ncbi:MAG: hypothetical protein HKN97_03170 [Myxococcales bacterium]|nr:hypothetical protein [Deltaproteobacteria bacterium]NND27582.1 hypothetical protein [Myxococcales bacterium]NNK06837.1 hypothetical protein [Myxococcales bacterium]NNL26769.1 hypothetical protein [Myxococcales bacterium]
MMLGVKRLHCCLALIVFAFGSASGCDVGGDALDGGVGDAGGTGGSQCDGVTCDDGNPCTLNRCIPGTGCIFPAWTGPCEDGNVCTVDDACVAGVCTPGAPLDCDDHSACTEETCDPSSGCVHANRCDPHATCVGGNCECDPGYGGDGFVCFAAPGCGDGDCTGVETYLTCPMDCDHDLLVVVEEALAQVLGPSLTMYLNDLDNEGYLARIEPWTPGTVDELKAFLFEQVDTFDIEGALLIGNMPTAWFEQVAFDSDETFPMDVFLQDRDAFWGDDDNDGIYDSHSPLQLDIYVSRLPTLPDYGACVTSPDFPDCPQVYDPGGELYASEECIYDCPSRFSSQSWNPDSHPDVECCGAYFLKRYFDRVHDYRNYGSLVEPAALVFIDDDWLRWAHPFGLDAIYATVDVICDIEESTKLKYLEMLSGGGAQFVYHWLHSTPNDLLIYLDGNVDPIHRTQIGWSPHFAPSLVYNLEASFVNMFSCHAARFTVPNIGSALAFQTDYGLAIVGSTKNGGMWQPGEFHTNLAHGTPWGESFRLWYNNYGQLDDEWHLGMVVLGDPLLTLSGDVADLLKRMPPGDSTADEVEALRETLIDLVEADEVDTFDEYVRSNPQFFED